MKKIKWKKPNGNEIETNDDDAHREYCKSLGWKEVKEAAPQKAKKAKKK